jgi:ABC-type transport system involved in multi-copper enzyme maturation permease subunit
MNPTLVAAFLRQRLTSPIRLALLGLFFALPVLTATFMRTGLAPLGDSNTLVMIFAAGMIGQDVSSGVLQLLFARPVRRWEYVFSRWMAVGGAATIVGLLQVLAASALLAARGAAPEPGDVAMFAAHRVLECFGLAAVFAMLSSLVGGVGDLGLYLVGTLVAAIAQMVAQFQGWAFLARASSEWMAFLTPKLDLSQLAGASSVPLFPIASYLSTVALSLCLAVVFVNRKEFSYAATS